MNNGYDHAQTDWQPKPYVTNVVQAAMHNDNYRKELWTGCYGQMTLMCIPVCSDIGLEIHKDNDQIIRIEHGIALVKMGKCEDRLDYELKVCMGDTIFVPAGTWHNVINIGRTPLKVSAVYAPAHHPVGTLHHNKKDAEKANY